MRAIICGAGIAGLSLAQRLVALDWDVVVVEKSPGPRTQGYMMDFFGPGYDAAEEMGLLPRLKELAYNVSEWRYVDESGRRRVGLDYSTFARPLNGRLLSIMRPDLEQALREQVADTVELRFGTTVTQIDTLPDGVRVTLTDGTVLAGDVLVGADGVHSTVRRMVFGPEEQFFRYLGLHTAAYVFEDPEIHQQVKNRLSLTDTTQRQMGFYGLRGERVAVFAVHHSPDPRMPDDEQRALRQEYSSLGWVVPRALAKCPESSEVYHDQVAQIEIAQWSRGRVVLLGDSCQAVSLLAGQGASLAVAGAFVLGERLARAGTGPAGSVESALGDYQRLWQPVVAEKQRVGRRLITLFLPSSPWQLRLRRIVLRMMNLPVVGRYLGLAWAGRSTTTIQDLMRERAASAPAEP